MILLVLKILFIIIIGYLIGSIPTGYLVVKKLKGIDIRTIGSGSTGATNVKRILGTKWFYTVMLLDAIKGAVPVLIGYKYFNFIDFEGLGPVCAALGAVIGHSKSVFLKFTGGKSVATSVGTIIALFWPVGLLITFIWAVLAFFTKYVSLGSVVAISLAPVLMNVFEQNDYFIWYAGICAVYVVIMHKDNIKRLLEGTENKVRK